MTIAPRHIYFADVAQWPEDRKAERLRDILQRLEYDICEAIGERDSRAFMALRQKLEWINLSDRDAAAVLDVMTAAIREY